MNMDVRSRTGAGKGEGDTPSGKPANPRRDFNGNDTTGSGALDFLRPQVAAAYLAVPPETLAELIWHPYADKSVNAIYQLAFLGGRNVTIQHPCHTLKEAGGGNPEEINWRAFCYKCHPPARGGMKSLAKDTEAAVNSIWEMAQSAAPPEDASEKSFHALDELERRYEILSSRRAVTELHHPLHKQGKEIGCERCGTMPYQDAIFLFTRRYWNCLDYEWVRIALKKWRKEQQAELIDTFFKKYKQAPKLPEGLARALQLWQAVEKDRIEWGGTLTAALRRCAGNLGCTHHAMEDAYYDGLHFFEEYVAWSDTAGAVDWRPRFQEEHAKVVLESQ